MPAPLASPGLTRRQALRTLPLAGLAAGLFHPPGSHASAAPLPPRELLRSRPERFWNRLRKEQFLLHDDRVFLNPGSLGVMPRPVLDAVTESLRRGAEYDSDTVHRWGYESLEPERREMAEFLVCSADELAFTHNCTEAMSTIAHGLDLQPGDEVLLTNQEHPGGYSGWRARAARFGITVREVEIPVSPANPGELLDRILSAVGPRTRVLSFSGITSPTGLILPTRELCQAARERGLISVVDGAHMDGQIPVQLRELGCDFFAGSPHKWMFAPPGCGILYGRPEMLDRLWPSIVNAGWDNKEGLKSARFMMIGTNNRSSIDGMIAGLRFLRSLGEDVLHNRMRELSSLLIREVRRRPYLELVTPEDPRLHQAMVTLRFKPDNERLAPLWARMKEQRICVLGGQRVRISMHIHTRTADVLRFLETCDRELKGKA